MKKDSYSNKDVESHLTNHPDYEKILGTFAFSTNSVVIDKRIHFFCSEEEFTHFIDQLSGILLTLTDVSAQKFPADWIPFPGVSREQLVERYRANSKTIEQLTTDPNVILIQKVSDGGKKILWDTPDGRIGFGGHTTS